MANRSEPSATPRARRSRTEPIAAKCADQAVNGLPARLVDICILNDLVVHELPATIFFEMHAFDAPPPPLREDEHGVLRVGSTRVSLESVVTAFDNGASAEEIVESFPSVDVATVYATLAFVLNNRRTVDEYLSRRKEDVEKLRIEVERRFPAEGLRARLLSRRRSSSP